MENLPTGNYIERGTIYINDPGTCFICKKTDLEIGTKYCADCGFPQGGEQGEQTLFYRQHINSQVEYNDSLKSLKNGKKTLFWTAGLCVLSGLLGAALGSVDSADPSEATYSLIGGFVLAIIFVGLGFWADTQPMIAMVSGFAIFITVNLLGIAFFIYDRGNGRPPIGIVTVIIIIYLGRGISGVLKAEKLRKEKGWDWRKSQ